jgi:sugar-specific transcriptional regulator TrmB
VCVAFTDKAKYKSFKVALTLREGYKKAMNPEQQIQTLKRLGLTSSQARIYLSLIQTGRATAQTIARKSDIPRPEVYRIMPTIQKLGLCEKALTAPLTFQVTPIEAALSILIDGKTREHMELQAKTQELLQKLKEQTKKPPLMEETPQFILIPSQQRAITKRRTLIQNAQTSINIITLARRLQRYVTIFAEDINKAVKRGVKFQVIVEKPRKGKFTFGKEGFEKRKLSNVRYVRAFPQVILVIYDNKEALIVANVQTLPGGSPLLWSNNPSLLAMAINYFEVLWLTSIAHDDPVLTEIP